MPCGQASNTYLRTMFVISHSLQLSATMVAAHPKPLHLLSSVTLLLLLLLVSSTACPSAASTVVTHLPGFRGPLPFHLETGYVNVDEANGSELFYYFVQSERSPEEDPVILWLTGGPRCSAFTALAFEIGPVNFVSEDYNGSVPNLVYNPHTWTKVANIIFQDSPVGSGFSFSRHIEGYDIDDATWSKHVYMFLIKWFADRPWFLSNPLYIGGDSYGGKIAPLAAQEIADALEVGIEPAFNLKGYLIGNPITGASVDYDSRLPYAHGVGIISDQLFELTQRNCEPEDHGNPINENCARCLTTFGEIMSEVNIAHILEPMCTLVSPRPKGSFDSRRILDEEHLQLLGPPERPPRDCRSYGYFLSYHWVNSNITREALQIKEGTVPEWQRCSRAFGYRAEFKSNIKHQLNLMTRGYRTLVYSGDHDINVPFLGTQIWIRSLNFSVVEEWRSWHVDGKIAGYTLLYNNNLTFATIKGAGHTAPEYKPKESFAMIERWLSHDPL